MKVGSSSQKVEIHHLARDVGPEFEHFKCTFEVDYCGLHKAKILRRRTKLEELHHGPQRGTGEYSGFGARETSNTISYLFCLPPPPINLTLSCSHVIG